MTKDPNFVSVRLPDDVANWLREYAATNNLVRAKKPNMGGSIVAIVRSVMTGQTISNNVGQPSAAHNLDIDSKINDAIAPLSARLDAIEVSAPADIKGMINLALDKQLYVKIRSLLAKIDNIESSIGSQDNKIAALEAIVVGLPTTFTSTEQIQAIVDNAIRPLLEALETNRSEAVAPVNYTQALTLERDGRIVDEVDGSRVKPLPIIDAIANTADPIIQNPLHDESLSEDISSTANSILTRPEALAIAQSFNPKVTGQNLYDWSKATLTAKSNESRLANSEKLAIVGLVAAFTPENKPAWIPKCPR